MSKPTLKTSSTVVLIPGQPSAELLAKLRQAGVKIEDCDVAGAVADLENRRAEFAVEAVRVGLVILAKKLTMKHGEFQKWAASLTTWEQWGRANRKRVSDLQPAELDNLVRSLRHYSCLAQHFLADLEQGSFAPDFRDQAVAPPAVSPDDVLALDTLPQETRIAVLNTIERFVAGRSLRRMLMDFRRAEHAADQEEAEAVAEAERRRRKTTPPPGQMDFWEDMLRPLGEIDTLFETPSFVKKTDRTFWTKVAETLEAQAKRARALAKEIAA